MNFLLVSYGSAGDIHPYLALGKALRLHKHRVIFITNEYFRSAVEFAGLEFKKVGTKEEYESISQSPLLFDSTKAFEFVAKEVIMKHMREYYDAIKSLANEDAVLIAQSIAPAARIAHEKLGIPYATFNLQPMSIWSIHQPPRFSGLAIPGFLPLWLKSYILNAANKHVIDKQFAPGINKFLSELGIPAQKNFFTHWLYSPQKVIVAFPEWFAKPAVDWPSHTTLTGFISLDNKEELSPEMQHFLASGDPPLVFTAGSAMQHAKTFFKTAVEVMQRLNYRAIFITSFPKQLPAKLSNNTFVCSFASYPQLFPKVKAVIHHGGIGTIAHVLAAGKPQLIVPFAHDQPDNAFRTEKLGVGYRISPHRFKAAYVTRKLRKLLQSPEVQRNCSEYSRKIDFSLNMNNLVNELEKFVWRSQSNELLKKEEVS
jgi:rhamnosyltransferase subunit B